MLKMFFQHALHHNKEVHTSYHLTQHSFVSQRANTNSTLTHQHGTLITIDMFCPLYETEHAPVA